MIQRQKERSNERKTCPYCGTERIQKIHRKEQTDHGKEWRCEVCRESFDRPGDTKTVTKEQTMAKHGLAAELERKVMEGKI